MSDNALMTLANHYEPELKDGLAGSNLSVAGYMLGLKAALMKTPALAEAAKEKPAEVMAAIMHCAQLGLSPSPVHQHFHLIPFNGRSGWQVQAIVGVRGYIDLAQRSGKLEHVDARVIYEGEPFDFDPVAGTVSHPFSLTDTVVRTDDKIIGAWAWAKVKGRTQPAITVLRRDEIIARKNRGGASKMKRTSPWDTDFAAMCRKTVLRALLNSGRVPLGEQAEAIKKADAVEEEQFKEADAEVVEAVREPSEFAKRETEPFPEEASIEDELAAAIEELVAATDKQGLEPDAVSAFVRENYDVDGVHCLAVADVVKVTEAVLSGEVTCG